MATLKIKKTTGTSGPRTPRAPVRGINSTARPRPTLADKEAMRAQRTSRPPQDRHREDAPRAPSSAPTPGGGHRRPTAQTRPALPAAMPGNTAFAVRAPFDASAAPSAAPPQPRPERAVAPVPTPQPQPAAVQPRARRATALAPVEVRLSKRMSELGIASRREADDWIAKGWVRVDGKVVNQLGSRVREGQRITVDTPAKFHQARKVTVLLNKPPGFVSGQAEDGHEPAWVLIKPENQWQQDSSGIRFVREHTRGLAPAGRLDIESVGLLVMTQDGRVAKQLIGEDSAVEKEYLVKVSTARPGPALRNADLGRLRHGLALDGVELQPAEVDWIGHDELRFVLREGRKRQIRRMCEAVDLRVLSLQRVRIGQVLLGDLPPGQWRYLRLDEGFEG